MGDCIITFGIVVAVIAIVIHRLQKRGPFYQRLKDKSLLPPGRYVLYDAQGRMQHVYHNLDDALLEAQNACYQQYCQGHPIVVDALTGKHYYAEDYDALVLPYMDDWE